MGKHKRKIQLTIFIAALMVFGYTVASSVMGGEERPPAAGDRIAHFKLETLGGGTVDTKELSGRPIVLNFWGTFCPPCVREIPALQRMYEKYADEGVVIVGVNLGEKPIVRVEQFAARFGVTYPIALDPDLEVRDRYGVRWYPTTFFIDASGVVTEVKEGEMTEEFIDTAIRRLIGQ